MFPVDAKLAKRSGELKYEQLKRHFVDQFTAGKFQPGDMLPTELELAEQLGVARNTVRQALRELESLQLIRRVRGKGTIVCRPGEQTPGKLSNPAPLFGLVTPELRVGQYQSLQAGLNHAMSAIGANMIVCDSGQDADRQSDVLLQLVHRGVSGVAMVPISATATPAHHVSFLRRSGVPLVFCHRRVAGIRAPLVGFAGFEMGHVAAAELARVGHRRVGMIFSHASDFCDERIRGVRAAMDAVGGTAPDEFVHFDHAYRADALPPDLESRLTEQLQRMLAQTKPPTAFVVSADRLAGVVCLALQKLGLSVPGDVSVIGFGDRGNRNLVLPFRLTSVTVDEGRLGEIAFETLAEMQRGVRPLDDSEDIMMPLEISDGETVGRPPRT